MVRLVVKSFLLIVCVSLTITVASAQDFGLQPFSTNDFGVDLATSAVNPMIPLRSKPGKLPFGSLLRGTFKYTVTDINGYYQWIYEQTALSPFGLSYGDSTKIGYVSTMQRYQCPDHTYAEQHSGTSIQDSTGAHHALPAGFVWNSPGSCQTTATATTIDGSGYIFVVTNGLPSLYDRSGNLYTFTSSGTLAASFANSVTDPDNSSISVNSAGTVITDTFNTTVATLVKDGSGNVTCVYYVANNTQSGCGSSGTASYTITYSTLNILTNFNCIFDYNRIYEASGSMAMPTNVTMPNGQSYVISYETTPGHSGYYTGRIASITLPRGGSISYAYSDANGHNGIDCNSWVIPTIKVTLDDNNGHPGVWRYDNSNDSSGYGLPGNFTVVKTDPAGNQKVFRFSGEYQTEEMDYQGGCSGFFGCNLSTGGTKLRDVTTCYSGNLNNGLGGCQTPSSAPTLPITQTDVYTWVGVSPQSLTETVYDSYGSVTSVGAWDWGAAIPPSSTNKISLTTTPRGSWNGSGCTQPISGTRIYDRTCYKNVNDGGGNLKASETFAYNSGGHVLTHQVGTTTGGISGFTLNHKATYNSNGTTATKTDANGGQTTYGYNGAGGCNSLLPTSITYPVTAMGSSSQTWDCNGGVMTARTDVNGVIENHAYSDPLWRQTEVWSESSFAVSTTYNEHSLPWNIQTVTAVNSSTNRTQTDTLDGLGRIVKTTTTDPNSSNGVREIDKTYNNLGQLTSVTNPYLVGDTVYSSNYTYDALNRIQVYTEPDGNYFTHNYAGRASEIIFGAGTANTTNDKISQVNGIGKVVSVCEVTANSQMGSSNNQPTACGLDITPNPNSGFLTTYGYDTLGNLTSVSQAGLPNRTYQYDAVSRMTSESTPEAGSATNTYDATGQQGDLATRVRNSVTTTYSFDKMHRKTQVSYSDTTPSVLFGYDQSSVTQGTAQISLTNSKGRLSSACTTSSCTTMESFSYDPVGRVIQDNQSTPSVSLGTPYTFNYTYDMAGDILTESKPAPGNAGAPYTYTNTYNAAGEVTDIQTNHITNTTSGTFATGMTYNAFGKLTGDTLGNNLTEQWKYDKLGHPTWYNLGAGVYQYGTDNSYPNVWENGYLNSSGDNINGNWTFTYDNFGRVSTANCAGNSACPFAGGGTIDYGYAYDRYGNRWQQNIIGGTGSGKTVLLNFNVNNQVTSNSYDGLGDVTKDGSYTYAYDAEGRQLTESGSAIGAYAYDAFGRRVRKEINSTTTYEYLYDLANHRVVQATVGGTSNYNSVYIGGRNWGYVGASGNTQWMATDWLGTGRIWTTPSGSSFNTCQNLPFGEKTCTTGVTTGGISDLTYDSDDSLYHANHRELSPSQGHWMHPDPGWLKASDASKPQSWNRYAYVFNNPVSSTDPTGLKCYIGCDDDGGDDGGGDGGGGDGGGGWSDSSSLLTGFSTSNLTLPDDLVSPASGLTGVGPTEDFTFTFNGSTGNGGVYAGLNGPGLGDYVAAGLAGLNAPVPGLGGLSVNDALLINAVVGGISGALLADGLNVASTAGDTITGFRAVSESELYSINDLGAFSGSPLGSEYKYFSNTLEQSQSFGTRMYGEGNFGLVQGVFPTSVPIETINPATEGPGFVVPNAYLPTGTPTILWP